MSGPYREVLGEAWAELPALVRAMHVGGRLEATGRADVELGRSLPARVGARLFGLPLAGADQPLRVRFEPDGRGETWTRWFGERRMSSRQWADGGLLWEALGAVTVGSAVSLEGGRLHLTLRRWRLLGVPMPLALAPRVTAVEGEADGRYVFDIALAHPLTGLVVRYRGWLVPTEGAP